MLFLCCASNFILDKYGLFTSVETDYVGIVHTDFHL